jgi:hypothetical protein
MCHRRIHCAGMLAGQPLRAWRSARRTALLVQVKGTFKVGTWGGH